MSIVKDGHAAESSRDVAAARRFEIADRRCRIGDPTSAQAHLDRGVALQRLGFDAAASIDLDLALSFGSNDNAVLDTIMAVHPVRDRRETAARWLAALDRASDAEVSRAARFLLGHGTDVVLRAARVGPAITGQVLAPRSAARPIVRVRTEADGLRDVAVVPEPTPGAGGDVLAWRFATPAAPDEPVVVVAAPASGRTATLTLYAATMTPAAPAGHEPRSTTASVTVLVPIYGDPSSLAVCLAALERQGDPDIAHVIVDDASPDPEVTRLARDFCRRVGGRYLRNAMNAGFAASVNRGLSLCPDGDVLILNSDVVLPPDAIVRLREAARSRDDIGIAAPFSNDAGNTTFPEPLVPGPARPAAVAAAIDAAARRVNAGRVVDLPSVLGSCLYIRRSCLDAVGGLSLAYGRGYFEDVDLCLRAAEKGFRVVAACDTYVSHASGRSFGSARDALVVRNLSVLDARFPDHAARDAATDRADPLRPARAAIEEALAPPPGPCVVLLGRDLAGRAVGRRQSALRRDGVEVLSLDWRSSHGPVEVGLRSSAAGGARALAFTLDSDGTDRLTRYLSACTILRIEVFEPQALPAPLGRWLRDAGLPLVLVADGREAALAASTWVSGEAAGPGRADVTILPTDAMAAACFPRLDTPRPGTAARAVAPGAPLGTRVARLGVLMPSFCAEAETLALALARRLCARPHARLIVLGRCMNEARVMSPGSAWVTGPVGLDALPEAVAHHGIDALLLPYRSSFHWLIEDLARHVPRPRAYFDWSPAGLPVAPGDLALDPGVDPDEAARRVVAWLAREAKAGA